ncbi:MAG: hypothetical protein DMF90_08240, partial [Acidobacteria bacterium]
EAGVNPALLHYYFRSKARLAQAVFERAATQLLPAVVAILGSDVELEQKVEQVIDVELRQLAKTPYLPGYILSELAHHPERAAQLFSAASGTTPSAVGSRVFKVLRAQIDQRVKAGRMHPNAPEQFAINLSPRGRWSWRSSASTRPASTGSSNGAAGSWHRSS